MAEQVMVQRRWIRLGLAILFLHYLFLLIVILLLEFDQFLALVVAVGLSVGGGVALLLYILYRF